MTLTTSMPGEPHFGDYGDGRFVEDYTTKIHGDPTGVIVTVARNAAGQAQHAVSTYQTAASPVLGSVSPAAK